MKSLKIALIVVLVMGIFLCSGIASAFTSDQASATAYWSSPQLYRAQVAFVRIDFQSNASEQLQIWRIGVQFDWMNETDFMGTNYQSDLQTVGAYGQFVCDPFAVQVPYNITTGAHNYVIGVDGYDASGADFTWTSPSISITVANPTSTSATPTPTAGGDGGSSFSLDWRMVVEGIAIAAIIIAVIILLLEMMKRRPKKEKPKPQATPAAQTSPAATPPTAAPAQQPATQPAAGAENKPEPKKEEPKDDYNI